MKDLAGNGALALYRLDDHAEDGQSPGHIRWACGLVWRGAWLGVLLSSRQPTNTKAVAGVETSATT